VALPTLALPSAAPVDHEAIAAAIARTTRRVAVLLTPGVLASWPALEGSVPRQAVSPSVDGPLVGVDDLIGATYFAICTDNVQGLLDVTLPRSGRTAALPPPVARWVDDLRVLKLLSPDAPDATPIAAAGFTPLNATLADTITAEAGWPAIRKADAAKPRSRG
jgi:hypothetical protein